MGRLFLRGMMVLGTVLFITNYEKSNGGTLLSVVIPALMIALMVINSLRFTRFVSWVIFAVSFFCFMVVLSAFTMGWRTKVGFDPFPFYRAIFMFVAFIYVSLAQIKILGGGGKVEEKKHEQPIG